MPVESLTINLPENKQVLYKQLGVTVNLLCKDGGDRESMLQDGGVGFDTMLIGF